MTIERCQKSTCFAIFAPGLMVLTLVFSLFLGLVTSSSVYAAEVGVMGGADASSETTSEAIPDSFGRDTPRQTVQRFISALGENDFMLASNYLNLTKSDNPTTEVRQFKQALDAGGRFLPDLQISNSPEGNLTDQLLPGEENVGSITIGEQNIPILLERVAAANGDQYWQFSTETLNAVPEMIENTKPTLVSRYTVESLEDKEVFGYQLADLVAAIVMIISSFLLTYIMVWLLYHFLRIMYPRVRGEPLPLPNKIVLPLSVVIMALILSEVMVYVGVSVALREPINRFTEIASWLAVTWLLLRLIDAIFTRAINMSYRKNYTERVSILGLMRKVVKALLLIFAVIVIFGNLGFDLTTGIAALGVGGLALALGAQKTIENLVGSVVVVADSPVRIGDYCKFGTYEGTVIDIGIRSSRVRTLTRTIVTVPNGDFSSMQIENFTSRDMFQLYHKLYLKRSADIDEVFRLVKDLDKLLDEHYLTNQEWNQVNIMELRQDCYVLQLQAYINANNVMEFYDKQNVVFVDVLNEVKKYNVEHALPTQQLIVDQEDLEKRMDSTSEMSSDDPKEKGEGRDADNNGTSSEKQQVDASGNPILDSEGNTDNSSAETSLETENSKNKSRAKKAKKNSTLRLAKLKYRRFQRSNKRSNLSLSIWNQNWE